MCEKARLDPAQLWLCLIETHWAPQQISEFIIILRLVTKSLSIVHPLLQGPFLHLAESQTSAFLCSVFLSWLFSLANSPLYAVSHGQHRPAWR